MRYKFYFHIVCSVLSFAFLAVLLFIGCSDITNTQPNTQVYSLHSGPVNMVPPTVFNGSGDEFKQVAENTSGQRQTYDVTVNSGQNPIWRLYFVITNKSNQQRNIPQISVRSIPPGTISGNMIGRVPSSIPTDTHDHSIVGGDSGDYGEEHVHLPTIDHLHLDFSVSAEPDDGAGGSGDSCPMNTPPNNKEGDMETFSIPPRIAGDSRTSINAIARVARTVGNQRVVFWASNDVYCGEGCTSPNVDGLIQQSDIEELADTFLKNGDDNDIYDWAGALFGKPWGETGDCRQFISAGHKQQIDILLYNIGDRDGNRRYGASTLGYYYPGNSYVLRTNPQSRSNERLLVMLHAPWLNVSDEYLESRYENKNRQTNLKQRHRYSIVSTLAHEYQHLINFYQRFVLDGADSQSDRDSTWLNEQFSLMLEDVLFNRLSEMYPHARDARGRSDLSAGSYGLCGRISQYLLDYGARGVSQWHSKLWNYGINFAFGSYLLRNYGGLDFIKDVYGTPLKDGAALSRALRENTGGAVDMGEAIRRWGVAILLSDDPQAPAGYRVNNGPNGFVVSGDGEPLHKVGSINYYNYQNTCSVNNSNTRAHGALQIFNTGESIFYTLGQWQNGHSNIIFAAAERLSGVGEFRVTLSPNQALTVVAKRRPTPNNPTFYDYY